MHLLLLLLACARPTSPDKVGSADDSGESTASDDTGDGLPPRSCAAPRLSLVQDFPFEVLPQIYDHRHTQQGVAIGDIDGDGWLDAILAYGGGSAGFRNNGAGDLLYDPQIDVDGGPLPSGQGAALADLDGDGDLDLYLGRDRCWPAQILTNDGLGHFTAATLPGTETATMTGSFSRWKAAIRARMRSTDSSVELMKRQWAPRVEILTTATIISPTRATSAS
jgi:hypothetical protein